MSLHTPSTDGPTVITDGVNQPGVRGCTESQELIAGCELPEERAY